MAWIPCDVLGWKTGTVTTPARLPAWTWDETVLAYDLYLRDYASPLRYPDGTHQAVKDLSRTLRGLPLHPQDVRADPRFRNPNSIARKIQNLMWQATGETAGSANGSAMDVKVVADLQDAEDVHRRARDIRAGKTQGPARATTPPAGQVSVADYKQAALGPDDPLETQVLAKRRTEQRFLRQHLLAGKDDGECAFCGNSLPSRLLIAAHVKRRADLSDAEKLDFDAVAVLACALGCDALYEAGYIGVSDNGTVIASDLPVPDGLRIVLDGLEGRPLTGFTPARAAHFADHRNSRFLR